MPVTLKITIRHPHKILWPNGGSAWNVYKVADIKKNAKMEGWGAAKEYMGRQPSLPVFKGDALVKITYYAKRKPFPDRDNLIAALKSHLDGLTKAGVWTDDKYVHHDPDPIFCIDKLNPRIELTITEYAPAPVTTLAE